MPTAPFLVPLSGSLKLTGPKPKEIKVETFRIDYLIRTPKVEKLSLQPIRVGSFWVKVGLGGESVLKLRHVEALFEERAPWEDDDLP